MPGGLRTLALVASLLLLGVQAQPAPNPLELEVLRRTNQVRLERGLSPLQWDLRAYQAAQAHAQDMLKRGYFAHQNPEGLGAAERMRRAGVVEVGVGENLARFEGYADGEIPRRALEGWMGSPGHRANLLRPEFTHLGVGLVRQGQQVVVVQNFLARPFDPQVRLLPAQAERRVLWLQADAPGRLGVFVDNQLYAQAEPPLRLRLELPPQGELRYALFDGQSWWPVRHGEQGVRLEAALERTPAPGWRVRLRLPVGQYALAVGETPRLWRRVAGPADLELVLPASLEALWLGLWQEKRVQYSHRIPLP